MPKIFFYKKRNYDGSLSEDVIDCDEYTAWKYHRQIHLGKFYYVGWSDGSVITAVRNKTILIKDKNNLAVDFTKEQKEKIREAHRQEIQNAIDNPDKTPPRNGQVLGLGGGPPDPRIGGKAAAMAGQ